MGTRNHRIKILTADSRGRNTEKNKLIVSRRTRRLPETTTFIHLLSFNAPVINVIGFGLRTAMCMAAA